MIYLDKPSLKTFGSNVIFLVSAIAFCFLNATSRYGLAFSVVWCVMSIVLSACLNNVWTCFRMHVFSRLSIIVLLVVGLFGLDFFSACYRVLDHLGEISKFVRVLIALICTTAGVVASFYSIFSLALYFSDESSNDTHDILLVSVDKHRGKIFSGLRLLIAAGILFPLIASVFNRYIWLDEVYSLRIVSHSFTDIFRITAVDVHPPLYYFILKIFVSIGESFGTYGITAAGKICSIVPVVLLCLLIWYKLTDLKRETRLFIIAFMFFMPHMIRYTVEIRMYSWALLFVTAAYLFAIDILKKGNVGNWIMLVLFSILCGYIHNYALLAMSAIWLYLLISFIVNKHGEILKWLMGGIVVAGCYMPWFLILLRQVAEVRNDYWISKFTIFSFAGLFVYIFSGMLCIIPLALLSKKHSIQSASASRLIGEKYNFCFKSGLGVFVVVTTILIGVVLSIAMQPILISRYILPCLLCMWIDIFMFIENKSKKLKALVFLCTLITSLSSIIDFTTNQCITYKWGKANYDLMHSIENENNPVILTDGKDGHGCTTPCGYTNVPGYWWKRKVSSFTESAIDNWQTIDDVAKIDELLSSDHAVFYFETMNEDVHNFFLQNRNWSSEYYGDFYYEGRCASVYRLDSK